MNTLPRNTQSTPKEYNHKSVLATQQGFIKGGNLSILITNIIQERRVISDLVWKKVKARGLKCLAHSRKDTGLN